MSVANDFLEKQRGIKLLDTYYPVEVDKNLITYWYNKRDKRKYRKVLPDNERKLWQDEGELGLFWPLSPVSKNVVLTEGETDCLRLAQELGEDDWTVCAIPGVDGLTAQAIKELHDWGTDRLLVVLDNDKDYAVAARVDEAWVRIRKVLPLAKRLHLPSDVKDICEFFDSYSVTAFQTLIEAADSGQYHYTPLDFSKEPPPYDWLLEGLICRGDVVLLQGESNVGKSFFTMGLTAAIAEGHDRFINHKLHVGSGRVLYIDEENPEDVVRTRLLQLGLTKGNDSVRYLYRQGIRVDRQPEKLLSEALAFKPDLIVLDSLTRLHTQNENESGSVAKLFNDGINPLARETGAAVIFLHHANKSESNNSFSKTRGSSDIGASPDAAFELRKMDEHGRVNLVHFKSRRGKVGVSIPLYIRELDENTVRLVVAPDPKEGW